MSWPGWAEVASFCENSPSGTGLMLIDSSLLPSPGTLVSE